MTDETAQDEAALPMVVKPVRFRVDQVEAVQEMADDEVTDWSKLVRRFVDQGITGKGATMVRAEGVVWCRAHATIHDDSTDPYRAGGGDSCARRHHRPVFYRLRKGETE